MFSSEVNYPEKEALLKLIIQSGLDINKEDSNGKTPLLYSIKKGDKKIINLLIKNGADVNAKNPAEDTPLAYAVDLNRKDIVEFLIENGAEINTYFYYGKPLVSKRKNESIAKLLIEKGADVNSQAGAFNSSVTPLFYWNKNIEVAKLLIDRGADINFRSDGDFTPLFFADKEVTKLLINLGANIHVKDNFFQRTPLFYVKNRDTYQLLIKYSAEIPKQNPSIKN